MNIDLPPAINTLMKNESGMSLVELMAALAILGVLVAVAMPSFGDLVKNNRIATQANTIIAATQYARSEAVTRGVNTRLEPIVSGTNWTQGWLVRIDGNDDNDFDDTEDVIIRNYEGVEGSTLTSVEDDTTFYPGGDVDSANTLTLRATECTDEHQRIINLSLSGLASLSSNKNC